MAYPSREDKISHLRRLKDGHTSKRRLGEEFRRLAVAGVVELGNLELDTVVFGSDKDLEGTEVGRVRPELLLASAKMGNHYGALFEHDLCARRAQVQATLPNLGPAEAAMGTSRRSSKGTLSLTLSQQLQCCDHIS